MSFTPVERRVTGWSALLGGALSLVTIGLYFVYSGPPPASNVLSRSLTTVVTFTLYLVFATGLGRLLRSVRGGDAGLAGQVAVTSLLSYVVVTLVASSLEVGTVLQYPDGSLDPTVDGPLAAGMVLLHGPVARILVATFLIALTAALSGRGCFPRWVLTGSVVLAVTNLALLPSLFFGMDAAQFYAANGWGATASIGAVNVIWFAVLGRAVLGSGRLAGTESRPLERAGSLTH
jgi:uncharacterized membrane protein YcfT